MKCPFCDKENPAGAKFCKYCGARLEEGPQPEKAGSDEKEASYAAAKKSAAASDDMADASSEAAGLKQDVSDEPSGKPPKKKKKIIAIAAAAMVIVLIAATAVFVLAGNGAGFASGGVSLSGFAASEVYFAAGQEDSAVFTVTAQGEPGSVTLYKDGEAAAEMYDNGEDGDETAGDGVYTAVVSVNEDSAAQSEYSCGAGKISSESILVYVFDEPTDDSWDEMAETEVALEEIESGYADEDGYVPADDVQDVISEVAEYAQELSGSGVLIYYEENDDNVLFKFASGLSMVYEPDTGETDSGGDGVSMTVITCQPCLSGYPSSLASYMLLPDEAAATIAETFDNYTCSEETDYDDEEVTLSLIKSFGANQIVLWHGHGGYSTSVHSYLQTGDDYSYWYVQYWADYVQDRIIESASTGKACITAAFIDKYCENLDNSLFYLAACHSGQDSVLADSFLNKGAAAVVGMSDTILTEYDLLMMHAVMTYMTQINSETANYHTLSEALDAAKGDYGATDTDYSSTGSGAYLIIFGGTDAEEYRLGEADDTTLMYQLYYDKLMELQEEYGEVSVKVEYGVYEGDTLEEVSYYSQRSYEGLCCAKLVDFDADGTEELFVVFSAPITVAEYILYGEVYEMDCDYTVQVWAYKNGTIECVYNNKLSYWASYEDTLYYVNILITENGCYIAEGESGEGGSGFEYYTYDGDSFYVAQYNGYLLSETYGYDTGEQEEEYLEWAESIDVVSEYSFFAYEKAEVAEAEDSHYDDPDPADCEDTIRYLEEYSGAGSQAQDTKNLMDEEAFAEAVNGENVLYYLAADYDGDGLEEAFGITGDEPDDYFSNNDSIYFLSSDGTMTCVMSDTYGYLSTTDELIEAGNQKFMVWNVSAGSSAVSYIFGVSGGECYEPEISGNYEFFQADEDQYVALTSDYSVGWHDFDVNTFEYDTDTGEFILTGTRDYDWDTDTY